MRFYEYDQFQLKLIGRMALDKDKIAERLKALQLSICAAIEAEDGEAKFQLDQWERPGGGRW